MEIIWIILEVYQLQQMQIRDLLGIICQMFGFMVLQGELSKMDWN